MYMYITLYSDQYMLLLWDYKNRISWGFGCVDWLGLLTALLFESVYKLLKPEDKYYTISVPTVKDPLLLLCSPRKHIKLSYANIFTWKHECYFSIHNRCYVNSQVLVHVIYTCMKLWELTHLVNYDSPLVCTIISYIRWGPYNTCNSVVFETASTTCSLVWVVASSLFNTT